MKLEELVNTVEKNSNIDPLTSLPEETPALDKLISTVEETQVSTPFSDGVSPNQQEDFDFRIQKNLDPIKKRSEFQSGTAQAFNGIVGGALSGLATAVEDVSYIPNIATQFFGEDYEKNALAETMQSLKESIGETFPIYRSGDGTWDWDDGAIVWDSLKNILDSAIGFGLPGIGIAGGVSKGVSKGAKLFKALEGSKAMQAAITSVGSGLIMNDLEGTMMGVELYENLVKSGVDKEVAARKATEFKQLNRLFAITDALQVHGLFKGELPGGTRNALNPRGIIANLGKFNSSNLLIQGVKEGVEEIGQNVIQSEKEYEGLMESGKDELANNISTKNNLFDRVLDLATSDKAIYEGLLGFLGGGPQRVMSDLIAGNYGKAGQEQDKLYNEQQALIKNTQETLDKTLADFNTTTKLISEAENQGEEGLVKALKDSEFTKLMIKNFSSGTTASLENELNDIANLSPEMAQERGLKDSYKQDAYNALNELKKAEKQWNKLSTYPNREEVFFNIKKGEILNNQFTSLTGKVAEATLRLNEAGNRIASREINKAIKEKGLPDTINLGITFDVANLDADTYENPVQRKAYNQTRNYLKKTRQYKEFQEAQKQLKVVQDKLSQNDEEYINITSKEYQNKEYVKKIADKVADKVNQNYDALNKGLDEILPQQASLKDYEDIKKELDEQNITPEHKAKLAEKIDKAYKDRLNKETKEAPKVTEDLNSLDARYLDRPILLEHELNIASQKEGVTFTTLAEYKDYLTRNKKTGLDTTAATTTPVTNTVTEVKSTSVTKQPDTTTPVSESSNINAIINDMAFFKFDKIAFTDKGIDDSNTKVSILNRINARESMSLAEFKKKYTITEPVENWNESTQYTLKDIDNNPIPSTLNDSNVDLDYLRDGKLKEGDEIFYEVDREYNKRLADKIGNVDNFKVLLVKYDSGNRIIVGVLPKAGNNASLKTLREDIWNALKENKGKENIYQFPTKTKVKQFYSGKFWNTSTFNDPRKVLKEGQPYILSIAAKNAANKVELISGYTTDMGTKEIELPNGEKVFIIKDKDESAQNLTEGAVYQIIQAPDGKYYAYRTFTSQVKDMPIEFKQEIQKILTDIYNNTRDFVTAKKELQDWYIVNEFSYTKDKGFNWQNPETNIVEQGLTPEQLYIKMDVDNSFVSVKAYSGATQGGTPMLGASVSTPDGKVVNYNEYLAEKEIIYTDLNPIQNFHSQKFTIDEYQRTAKTDDINLGALQDVDDDYLDAKALMSLFNPEQEPNVETPSVKAIEDKVLDTPKEENKIPEDIGKPKKDIKGKFKFKLEQEGLFKKWDKAKEEAWFKARFPNVPITILEDLRKIHKQDINAQGLFYNAAVYIKENAGEGVTYHEAFHVAFSMYLDNAQQASILKEARAKLGYEGTDLEVEEKLADKFMEQVLSNQELKSVPAKIKDFFSRLWKFIKFYVLNSNDVDTLFYSIESNRFFDTPRFKRDVSKLAPKFSNPYGKNVSPFESYQATKTIRDIVQGVLEDARADYPKLDNKEFYVKMFDRTTKDNAVLEAYRTLRGAYYDDNGNLYPSLKDKPELISKINSILTSIYSDGKLGTGYDEVVRSFSTIGIKITDKYDTIEEDEENAEEGGVKGDRYSGSYAEENPMDRTSDRMKMWLNSIPNITSWTDSDDYDTTYNIFGYPESLPEDYARNFLLDNFSNSLDAVDMVNKIAKSADKNIWLNKVISDLNANQDLRTDLFLYLQNVKANFIFVKSKTRVDFDNSTSVHYIVSNSNSSGVVKTILNDWDTGFNSSVNRIMDDGKINTKEAVKNYNELLNLTKKLDNSPTTVAKVSQILEDTGLGLPGAALDNLSKDVRAFKIFTTQFAQLYKLISEGENPFVNIYEDDNVTDKTKAKAELGSANLRKMAEQIKKTYPSYYQPTHVNTEGNKVFNHIRASFMGRMLTKLTNSDINARKEFIQSYLNTNFYKDSPFLQALQNDTNGVQSKLSFNIFDGLEREGQDEGIPYSKLSEAQLNIALLNLWFNDAKDTSYYGYPVLSDTGNMVLLSWQKYNKAQALDGLYKTALQEWSRIQTPDKPNLKNFNKNGDKFVILPFLNKHKALFNVSNEVAIKKVIEDYFDSVIVPDYFAKLEKWSVISKAGDGYVVKDKQLDSRFGNLKEKITDFVYADTLMQIQSAITFSGDVAYFKSVEDFYKRNKQVWSPGTYIDVTRLDGDTSYKVKVIKDIEGPSRFADIIEKNLLKAGFNKKLAKEKSDLYRSGVNETDAQAYVDIYSYKQRLKGLGRWTEKEEAAFNRIVNNEAKNSDYNVILQTLKPFVFTHTINAESNLIVPLQLKNSEMLLIPQFAENSSKLRLIMQDFGYTFDKKGKYTGFDLKKRNTDEVMFESAVKVGLQAELKNWDKLSEVSPYLVDYADYRLQQETPVHHLDDENLLGSQIKKLIVGDLSLDDIYKTPSGKEFTGRELIKEYNLILNKEIEDKYGKLSEKLSPKNLNNVINAIKQEVLDKGLSKQLLDALEPTADGSTVLPLWHPLIYYKVETMLNSIVKNNGTKLKFNGGSFYNASAFGYDDTLDIVFNEDGSINYFEAMMPAWSKDFVKYATDEEGNLDLKKLEEAGIDTGIVYRIPTENKYSMFRIKVKGFTPDIAGGAILLPSLITKVAGLDFDIDKVYAMLYNHKVVDGKLIRVDNSLDSQEGRQNYLLDLMSAVLTNKASLNQQLTPGGFSTLERLAEEFKPYTVSKLDTGYFSPNTRTDVFTNMMTGANNIGIFANMNATHQLYQNAENYLGFVEPILFDEHTLSDLRTFDDVTGNRKVTDNIAEFLAAAVDNGKNPLAAYLNINSYTADVIGSIIAVGYSIETALSFVNQPSIRKLTEMYFLEKGRMSEVNMFNTLQNELKGQVEKILGNNEAVGEWNFTTDEMMKYVKYNGNTEGRNTRFYLFQSKILDTFSELKEKGGTYSKLIAATKVSDSGPGPTFAETTAKLRVVNKTTELGFERILKGASKFFAENTPNNNLRTKFITDATNNFFNDDNITYVFNDAIQEILDEFELLKQDDLSAKEIEGIQRNIISFLATGFEAYDSKDAKTIARGVPKRLLDYKAKKKGKSDYEPFLAYLKIMPNKNSDTQAELPFIIEFDGNTGSNVATQDNIIDTWEEMLKNGNKEERELAKDLVRYTFYSAGFNFAPHSFYHIVPVSFFRTLTDSKGNTFDKYLEQRIKDTKEKIHQGNSYLENFKEQYIRNYFQKLSFIKKAIFEDANRKNVSKIEYTAYKNNKPARGAQPKWIVIDAKADSNLVKKQGNEKIPNEYIKHSFEGKNYLFKLAKVDKEKGFLYTRVPALGLKIRDIGSLEFDINNGGLESKWAFNQIKTDSSTEITKNSLSSQDLNFMMQNSSESEDMDMTNAYLDTDIDVNLLTDVDFDVNITEEPIKPFKSEVEVVPLTTNFTRTEVEKDKNYIYLFTDNAKRTSGKINVNLDSWYVKKYQTSKHIISYPSMTQAVIRGLNNAFPITTMVDDNRTQWRDSQFEEYKKIIDDEIETIKNQINNFKGIKFAAQMPFGKGKISNMKESAPKIWGYLNQKLKEIGIDNTGEKPVIINNNDNDKFC